MKCNKLLVVLTTIFLFSCGSNYSKRIIQKDATGAITETVVEEETPEADKYGVDLGLSVSWAECNVGATSPEETGYEIPYGNTSGSVYYNENTPANISNTSFDIAKVKLGDGWRMPTETEMRELIENCNMQSDNVNGVMGVRLTAINGNSIFLPACGSGVNANWDDEENNRIYKTAEPSTVGHQGGYWTGSESNQGRKQLDYLRKQGYDVIDKAEPSVLLISIDERQRNIRTVEPKRSCFPVRAVHD